MQGPGGNRQHTRVRDGDGRRGAWGTQAGGVQWRDKQLPDLKESPKIWPDHEGSGEPLRNATGLCSAEFNHVPQRGLAFALGFWVFAKLLECPAFWGVQGGVLFSTGSWAKLVTRQ